MKAKRDTSLPDTAPNQTRRCFIGAALILPAVVSGRTRGNEASTAVVNAPVGTFSGISDGGIASFRGVRYGIDTAKTRFLRPIVAPPNTSTTKAWQTGSISPQRGATAEAQSEDCLFLNIWTPSVHPRARRTVMVYVHGGAYASGSGNDPLTDGSQLSMRGDVVVVTVTHRLNALGYLSLARIDPRFPDSGNAGQLDLVLALRWVRDNIASFGGDPGNVMVFGQSGGGAKIATLMAMPAAMGLFQKAATMSGQQVTVSGPQNATRRARAFLAKLGVDPATAPVQKLVEALAAVDPILGGNVYFGPVLDGRSLLRHPFYPDAHPQWLSIPMMLGNTIAETRAFFPADHPHLNGLDWHNITERIGPELRIDISPELVVDSYRQWFPQNTPAEIFIAATTASRSWRGQVIEAEERARASAPAFVYQLDFEQAAHTADIGLVFGTKPAMTAAQRAMNAQMMAAFITFAKTGNPGWPGHDLATRKTMVFDTVSRVENDPRGRERRLFEAVPYVQPGS